MNELKALLGLILFSNGIFFGISSFVYMMRDDHERWFSRLAMTLVCTGFLYIGECIKEKRSKDV